MGNEAPAAEGVKQLVARLRDDGVQAGQKEAERIVNEAKAVAAEVLRQAREEAECMRAQAKAEIKSERQAALGALKLAARDTGLELRSEVEKSFRRYLGRLVSNATLDEELIRSLVLVLAGQAVEDHIRDKRAHIAISSAFIDGAPSDELRARTRESILALAGEMLREGIVLVPDEQIRGGAKVRLVDDEVELDLSDKAISRLLQRRMLPRFRAILEGEGEAE